MYILMSEPCCLVLYREKLSSPKTTMLCYSKLWNSLPSGMRHVLMSALVPKATECGSLRNDQTSRTLSFASMNLVIVFPVLPALREAETQVASNDE